MDAAGEEFVSEATDMQSGCTSFSSLYWASRRRAST